MTTDSVSIKNRIYCSFFLLVLLFVVNGLYSIVTLNNNRKLSDEISKVLTPALESTGNFEDLLVASKIFATSWVFMRSNQEDKNALIHLHKVEYPELKHKVNGLLLQLDDETLSDSIHKAFSDFETLLAIEQKTMHSLKKFGDYDDPVTKFEAERMVEEELVPRTASITNTLDLAISYMQDSIAAKNEMLEKSFLFLRTVITVLAIVIICIGIFLSLYMTRVIISPIHKIRHIVNNLGKGIIQKLNYESGGNEIGDMIRSVNNLSDKLMGTAVFAAEIGNRNFDSYFEPLGEEDTLGKALVAMRANLKESDARLQEAQHIAHLGSWERDYIKEEVIWSDEMFTIFELQREDFRHDLQSFLNFIHPEDLEHVKGYISRNPTIYPSAAFECRIVTTSGTVKTLYIEDQVFANAQGERIKTTGIMQDITERKKSSLALEVALAQLKQLFESIDQAFFSVDISNRKILQVSSACEKIYGYPPEDFYNDFAFWKGRSYYDDLHIIERGMATMAAGLPAIEEYRIIHKDKSIRWVEAKFTPILDNEGRLSRIDGVVNDIGKRKAAESERDLITADLIERNKDLEQFTYIVSHNLRAPVTNIMALSNLLNITATNTNKEYDDLLNGLSVSIQKLDAIILDLNQILTVRTPGYEKKETICLQTIVEDIKASIKHIIDKENAVIQCEFDDVKTVFALKSYIYSIFYNLIVNSLKYKRTASIPEIKIKSSIVRGKTYILFKDNGKGIDIGKNGKDIFKLYKRFDTTIEGKGIGLYMVKTAVETLGGTIALHSEIDKGCEFRIEFPTRPNDLIALSHSDRTLKATNAAAGKIHLLTACTK